MVDESIDYTGQFLGDINMRIRDAEEKQRILKERVLLIGQNLVEIKEKNQEKILEIKKDLEIIKQKIERMASFLEIISGEFSKFAKKDDLEILAKQVNMLKPFIKNSEKLKNK